VSRNKKLKLKIAELERKLKVEKEVSSGLRWRSISDSGYIDELKKDIAIAQSKYLEEVQRNVALADIIVNLREDLEAARECGYEQE
jgi:hypothetical protein